MTGTGSERTQPIRRLGSKSTSFAEREAASGGMKMFGALSCEQPNGETFSSSSTSRIVIINKCQKVSATTRSKEQERPKSRPRPQMSATTLNGPLLVGLVLVLQSVALLASCSDAVSQQRPLTISSEPQPRQPQQVATATETGNKSVERHRRGHREEHYHNGRLIDSIAEPLQTSGAGADQNQDKLNYIIDFLKHNKLTKFCDLIQNGNVRVRELIKQLNAMSQFTLFVPTDEALLIMSSAQLEAIEESPEEARQFLMAHATGELVLPRLSDAPAVQSLGQLTSKYSPLGAQNRWSSGRPLERIVQQPPPSASSQTVLYSLAGGPLRIITTPVLVGGGSNSTTTRLELIVNGANVLSGHSHALQEPNNTNVTYAIVHLIDRPLYPASKASLLERIGQVAPRFGRLLLASQDQALLDRLRSGGGQQLTTAFVPNDDAFRSIPSKLLDQLETNRTFLQHFLRSHLAEGVFYSGQLTGPPQDGARNGSQPRASTLPRLLTSMAPDIELQFETKMIQSRQLILVNSIPIVDQDLAVLNGALHVIVRPLFDRGQLDAACHCESGKQLLADSNQMLSSSQSGVVYDPQAPLGSANKAADETRLSAGATLSSWFQNAGRRFMASPTGMNRNELGGGNQSDQAELEREETNERSQQLESDRSSGKIVRAQRSENLVARNNRDFYRPSTAPLNLLAAELGGELEDGTSRRRLEPLLSTSQQTAGGGGRGFIGTGSSNELRLANLTGDLVQSRPSPSSFEVERYKIVMDANMRQRLREQQQAGGLIMSSSLNHEAARPPQGADLFAYDQPLATPSGSIATNSTGGRAGSSLWTYSPNTSNQTQPSSTNGKSAHQLLNLSASIQRHQRLLRFQAEDARDGRLILDGVDQPMKTASSGQVIQRQQTSKTAAPPNGANFGCAFYDTECKRLTQLSAKFVRLPARFNGQTANGKQVAAAAVAQFNQSNQAIQSANHNYQPTTPASVFDTSFGETTIRPPSLSPPSHSSSNNKLALLNNAQPGLHHIVTPPQMPKNYVSFNPPGVSSQNQRVSLLNQPLPPWSVDEQNSNLLGHQQHQQQPHSGHLSGQLTSTSSQNVNWRAQDIGDLARLKQTSGSNQLQQANNSTSLSTAPLKAGQSQQVLLVPVELFQDSNISLANARQQLNNSMSQNRARPIYFAPPSGQLQQQRPAASPTSGLVFHSNSQYFTPTVTGGQDQAQALRHPPNLSRLSNFTALEPINSPTSSSDTFDASSSHLTKQRGQRLRDVTGPTHQMVVGDEQRLVNETFQSAIEQARKIVRLQSSSSSSSAPYQLPQAVSANRMEFAPTSTQSKGDISITSARLTRPQSSGLVVQASNQALDVSGPSSGSRFAPANLVDPTQQQDFFQNRTIAEVMDDSGLRIDGQQVTFGRLRDCLDQAGLSNLIVQQGNPLTIFMPTDTAFQRLVQQQTAMQQQRGNSNNPPASARLADLSSSNQKRHLLPLVVARAGSQRPESGQENSEAFARLTSSDMSNPLDSSLVALAQKLTLDCSTPQVRQLLLDHLSSQLITPKQLQSDLVLNTLSGKRLLLSSVPSKKIVVVDGQPVIAATRAKNGMVYVLNKFLNISQQVPTVIDLLESQPNLKTFQSYLTFASLSDRLKRETGPITILAPTNEAFEQLSSAARQLLNSDPAAMMDILRGHIIEGAQFGKLISMRNRLKTMNSDHFIEAKVIKPNVYQLDNQMTSMRLIGTSGNGVVNSIDRLIVPPWLRVSPGAVGTNQAIGRLSAVSSRVALPESVRLATNELDTDSRSNLIARQQNSILNLPSLNNRPLRFEQPQAARLAPTNSFSLTGSSTVSPLDGFDLSQPSAPSVGTAFETNFNLNDSRPFSRASNDLPPAGGRLSGGSSAFDPLNSPTGANDLIPVGPMNGHNNTNNVATASKNMRLIEKLATLMKARKFVKYLLKSRLSESLKPDMNYVILVPTDQAIERLPKQIIDVLDRDLDRLSDLVNFHVLDTTFEYINTIPDGQTLNTLNEKDILFNWHRNNTILTASGAVVLGGIQEENIALLIVDRVLYPTPGDLLSIVTKSPILSNFTSLIKNAGLEKQLSLAGPFTLFAPSDFAFNQLDKRDLEFLQQDRDSVRRFLLRHMIQPAIFTSSIALSNTTETRPSAVGATTTTTTSIVPLTSVTNSLGEELVLRQKNDYFSVNDVNFSYADVAATNGVVHVIDGLL